MSWLFGLAYSIYKHTDKHKLVSPVNWLSESAELVEAGGEVAPSQAAVEPASDGVVLLACILVNRQTKTKKKHELVMNAEARASHFSRSTREPALRNESNIGRRFIFKGQLFNVFLLVDSVG